MIPRYQSPNLGKIFYSFRSFDLLLQKASSAYFYTAHIVFFCFFLVGLFPGPHANLLTPCERTIAVFSMLSGFASEWWRKKMWYKFMKLLNIIQGSIGRAFGRKLKNEFGSLDDTAGHHRTRDSPWRPHISAPILQTSNAANTNLETTQV